MLLTSKRNKFYKPADSVKSAKLSIYIKNIGPELKLITRTIITICIYKVNPLGEDFPGILVDKQEFKIECSSDEVMINDLICCSGQYITISSHDVINVDIKIGVSYEH